MKKGLPFFLVFGIRQKQFNHPCRKLFKIEEVKPLSPLLLQEKKRLFCSHYNKLKCVFLVCAKHGTAHGGWRVWMQKP